MSVKLDWINQNLLYVKGMFDICSQFKFPFSSVTEAWQICDRPLLWPDIVPMTWGTRGRFVSFLSAMSGLTTLSPEHLMFVREDSSHTEHS